mgnify:CR=1 FL=1
MSIVREPVLCTQVGDWPRLSFLLIVTISNVILVVLFTLAMSAVGGSMMVLARTEAISSANYRMMSQARYGAESGVHRAIHFLLNSYAKPGTAGDPRFGTTMSCAVLDLADNSARIIEYTHEPEIESAKI